MASFSPNNQPNAPIHLFYRNVMHYSGFGTVLYSWSYSHTTYVAVKAVQFGMWPDKSPYKQLLIRQYKSKIDKQVEKLKKSDFPKLVQLYTINESSGDFKLIIQKCYYEDIFQWVCTRGILTLQEAYSIIRQLLEAVQYLHAQNYICGHLSPLRILFDTTKPESLRLLPDWSVRTLTFGLSKTVYPVLDCEAPEFLDTLVQQQSTNSTEPCEIPLTASMDLYNVGCIGHIILTGTAPFVASSPSEVLELIGKSRQKLNSPFLHIVHKPVIHLLQTLLSTDLQKRASAESYAQWDNWYDQNETSSQINIKALIEYDLISTWQRYLTNSCQLYENLFLDQ